MVRSRGFVDFFLAKACREKKVLGIVANLAACSCDFTSGGATQSAKRIGRSRELYRTERGPRQPTVP